MTERLTRQLGSNSESVLFTAAARLSLVEIEILEMGMEGFSDAQIGREIGIGGRDATRAARRELAWKFGLTAEELTSYTPQILQIALANRERTIE